MAFKTPIEQAQAMKQESYSPSDLTNIKVLKSRKYHDFDDDKDYEQSLVSYLPHGSFTETPAENRQTMYGVIRGYDGSPRWTKGAIVAATPESAEEDFESQYQLATQGRDKYLGRAHYDKDWFNLLQHGVDEEDEGLRQKYANKYGWDFSKSWDENLPLIDARYGHVRK